MQPETIRKSRFSGDFIEYLNAALIGNRPMVSQFPLRKLGIVYSSIIMTCICHRICYLPFFCFATLFQLCLILSITNRFCRGIFSFIFIYTPYFLTSKYLKLKWLRFLLNAVKSYWILKRYHIEDIILLEPM